MHIVLKIRELVLYREMIYSLVRRDLKGRYKGSVLGFLWTFLNPLFQLMVYTLVFSVIMKNNIEKYYLFLFVALVPWMFFSAALNTGSTCILGQSDMINKIYFPREILPIANVTSGFVNMLLSFLVVLGILIISGFGLNIQALLYLPMIMVIEFILTLGLVFLVSSITVYLRDLSYILTIITMAWQFLTPVMYSSEDVPRELLPIFNLNPMTAITEAYRDILYYKAIPEMGTLCQALVYGIVFLVLGFVIFDKLQRGFAEEL
ncbi:MAG: ABC transporter permease [Clostridium sp.]|uniref:ABC transporter permease n=1 Tax=Enterocloster sp. HCN-30185 TaxID=3134663 RepID=UPI0030BF3022